MQILTPFVCISSLFLLSHAQVSNVYDRTVRRARPAAHGVSVLRREGRRYTEALTPFLLCWNLNT
jgi:hypothetical protein